MKNNILKIGCPNYWNLHPLNTELITHLHRSTEISYGVPSIINSYLGKGFVSLAPCSSVCLFTQEQFEIAIPMGITATGKVKSVYWGFYPEHKVFLEFLSERVTLLKKIIESTQQVFNQDPRKIAHHIYKESRNIPKLESSCIPALKISKDSASSTMLTKIFVNLLFGSDFYFTALSKNEGIRHPKQRSFELLIGDDALKQRPRFYQIIDLGELWQTLTTLPFVYAVWQSRGLSPNGWRRNLIHLGELAEKKMKASPTSYLDRLSPYDQEGTQISLINYWKTLRYLLTKDDFKGLLLFLCLTREEEPTSPHASSSLEKIIRWQELLF